MHDKSYLSDSSYTRRKVINIIFICSGNTCRSYIAEAVATHLLKTVYTKKYPALKDRIIISSAGTSVSLKDIPLNTLKVLDFFEIPNIRFKPKPADRKIIKNSDLIITMATTHRRKLIADFPEADITRIFNLLELSNIILYLQSEEIFKRSAVFKNTGQATRNKQLKEFFNDIANVSISAARSVTAERIRQKIRIIKEARSISIINPAVIEVDDPFDSSIDVYTRVAKLIKENIITIFDYLFS